MRKAITKDTHTKEEFDQIENKILTKINKTLSKWEKKGYILNLIFDENKNRLEDVEVFNRNFRIILGEDEKHNNIYMTPSDTA